MTKEKPPSDKVAQPGFRAKYDRLCSMEQENRMQGFAYKAQQFNARVDDVEAFGVIGGAT